MKGNFFQRIGGKIILIFVGAAVVSIGVLTFLSITRSTDALVDEAFEKLEAVQVTRKRQILDYMKNAEGNLRVVRESLDVSQSVEDLIRYHDEMGIKGDGRFDISGEGTNLTKTYSQIYEDANKKLSKYCDLYGYYDVFLICKKHGHVMYTYAKEADLGENLSSGKYSDTHLADMWNEVVDNKKIYMTDTKKYAPSGNEPAMFIGGPVLNEDGEMIAVMAFQIPLTHINTIMQDTTGMGESGESYLVGEDYLMRSDSRFSKSSTILQREVRTKATEDAIGGEIHGVGKEIIKDYRGVNVFSVYSHVGLDEELDTDFDWAIIAEIDESEVKEPVYTLVIFIGVAAIIILVAMIIVAIVFSRSISVPLIAGVNHALAISKGDLTKSIEAKYKKRNDEIGELALGLDEMRTNLERIAKNIIEGTHNIAQASQEIADGNQNLSSRTEEQAASLEETASSMEEMASTISLTTENTRKADEMMGQAKKATQSGVNAVKQTASRMQGISESSRKISDITKLIENIAFQTNILALNAAVEAARAGEQGRGFAVVASEVRNLAQTTSQSVKDIAGLIDSTVNQVEEGSAEAEEAGKILDDVSAKVNEVATVMDEISGAAEEQRSGVDQVNKAVTEMDSVTQQNASLVEEAASASEELSSQAQEVASLVQFFKINQGNRNQIQSSYNKNDDDNDDDEDNDNDDDDSSTAITLRNN